MKILAIAAVSLFTACATPDAPDTPTTSVEQGLFVENTSPKVGTGDANTTLDWDPNTMTTLDVWPSDSTITHVQVLIRAGAPYKTGDPKTGAASFYAFVVWNHNQVGRIYWIPFGNTGTDFHHTADVAIAQHANGLLDHGGGSDGAPGTGVAPTPHPNVDNSSVVCTFPSGFLTNVHGYAATLDGAIDNFAADTSILATP